MATEVQIVESCLVAPSEPTPRKGLWLSPLDLVMANRGHTPTVYLYRSDDRAADYFDPDRLKASLARALEAFYPLAGRLGNDNNGRLQINCNSEGALFVVARVDLKVDDFSDLKPSPELRRMFVPRIEPSSIVLAVQLTLFKCGGVALGVALDHVSIDALSAFHFIQTWTAFSRDDGSAAAVELPCHDRTLLRARSPPSVHPDTPSVFVPHLKFSETLLGSTATEAFAISHDQLVSLKGRCGGASTFCAVSALVWRCTCAARRLPPDAAVRLSFPANIRRKTRPPLPDRYFGNGIIWLGTTGVARDIASNNSLASVADGISGTIRKMDDELVRSAIDSLETAKAESRPLKGSMPATELRVNSWLGMPVYDADFGWGKPRAMSRAESVRGGFVYLMDAGPGDDCAVRVLMCMEAANIREFQRLLYANL